MSTGDDSVWAQFRHDPRRQDSRGLRAADRDRDVVLDALASAYADGRLGRTEHDERAEVTQTARTLGDLVPLLDDLVPAAATEPVMLGPDELRLRAEQRYEILRGRALASMLVPSLICVVVWIVGGFGPEGWHADYPWPLWVVLGTGIAPLRLVLRRAEVVAAEQERLERKERTRLQKEQRKALEPGEDRRPD